MSTLRGQKTIEEPSADIRNEMAASEIYINLQLRDCIMSCFVTSSKILYVISNRRIALACGGHGSSLAHRRHAIE